MSKTTNWPAAGSVDTNTHTDASTVSCCAVALRQVVDPRSREGAYDPQLNFDIDAHLRNVQRRRQFTARVFPFAAAQRDTNL